MPQTTLTTCVHCDNLKMLVVINLRFKPFPLSSCVVCHQAQCAHTARVFAIICPPFFLGLFLFSCSLCFFCFVLFRLVFSLVPFFHVFIYMCFYSVVVFWLGKQASCPWFVCLSFSSFARQCLFFIARDSDYGANEHVEVGKVLCFPHHGGAVGVQAMVRPRWSGRGRREGALFMEEGSRRTPPTTHCPNGWFVVCRA